MEERTPLTSIFGDTAQLRIVETLVLHPDFDYSLDELAEIANVSNLDMTTQEHILLDYQLMRRSVIKNNMQRYIFEKNSPAGKALNLFMFMLADIPEQRGKRNGKKN